VRRWIYLSGPDQGGAELNAAQARRVAADLLAAADELEALGDA
jgi:hypothetical protein